MEETTIGVIAIYENNTLRQQLQFKAHHKSSKAKLIDRCKGYTKIHTQEVIDKLKKEMKLREQKAAEKKVKAKSRTATK
jgi:hypothetical protein